MLCCCRGESLSYLKHLNISVVRTAFPLNWVCFIFGSSYRITKQELTCLLTAEATLYWIQQLVSIVYSDWKSCPSVTHRWALEHLEMAVVMAAWGRVLLGLNWGPVAPFLIQPLPPSPCAPQSSQRAQAQQNPSLSSHCHLRWGREAVIEKDSHHPPWHSCR